MWIEKPKFTSIYDFNGYDCCNAELESKRVFINSNGKLMSDAPDIEANNFCNGLCLVKFDTIEENKYPSPFPFNDDYEYELGVYGYVNTEGNVVIKPQYIYATGFYETDGNYAFVAKYIDSCIRWGMIDTLGNEIIPCKYPQLHYAYNGISYYDIDGKCGLMDMCGNIITKPMFDSIRDYNNSTNILLFESKEELYGAYNCSTNKIIIEPLYEDVDIDNEWIEVGSVDEDNYYITKYYDLDGNSIEYPKKETNYRNIPVVELSVLKRYQTVLNFKGLRDDKNNNIIPAVYSKLSYHDGLIIASETKTTNWRYRETVYKPDGTVVFKGSYKEIEIRDGYIKTLTPEGKITFKLTHKNSILKKAKNQK